MLKLRSYEDKLYGNWTGLQLKSIPYWLVPKQGYTLQEAIVLKIITVLQFQTDGDKLSGKLTRLDWSSIRCWLVPKQRYTLQEASV